MKQLLRPSRNLALPLVFALVALGGGCQSSKGAKVEVGGRAPAIDAPSIVEGQRVSTSGLKGTGYLVNFWGPWCEPCKRELPRLVAASGAGTKIVGVAVRSSNRQARELLALYGAEWPSATDPDASVAARWGVASGYPVTFSVDGTGTIRGKHFGELSAEDIAKLVSLTR